MADFLVYSLGHWQTPDDAWGVWRMLAGRVDGFDLAVQAARSAGSGLGLEELLSSVTVMQALSRPVEPPWP